MTRFWWNIRVCAVLQQPAYTILMAQSQPEKLSAHMDVVLLIRYLSYSSGVESLQ